MRNVIIEFLQMTLHDFIFTLHLSKLMVGIKRTYAFHYLRIEQIALTVKYYLDNIIRLSTPKPIRLVKVFDY